MSVSFAPCVQVAFIKDTTEPVVTPGGNIDVFLFIALSSYLSVDFLGVPVCAIAKNFASLPLFLSYEIQGWHYYDKLY